MSCVPLGTDCWDKKKKSALRDKKNCVRKLDRDGKQNICIYFLFGPKSQQMAEVVRKIKTMGNLPLTRRLRSRGQRDPLIQKHNKRGGETLQSQRKVCLCSSVLIGINRKQSRLSRHPGANSWTSKTDKVPEPFWDAKTSLWTWSWIGVIALTGSTRTQKTMRPVFTNTSLIAILENESLMI